MRWVLVALAAVLTACGGQPIDIPGDRHAVCFEWRIVPQTQLERVYREAGMDLGDRDRLHGFVGRTADGRDVIYTTRPTRLDDEATRTLGHEVLHIVAGDYH